MTIEGPEKHTVVSVGVSATSYSELVDTCSAWIELRRDGLGGSQARYLCFLSVHGIITAQDDREVREMINTADIVAPDGMPVVWALRSYGLRQQQRVYGPTAMLRLCQEAAGRGYRLFLYGGTEESLQALVGRLMARFPTLEIADTYAPPFRPLTAAEDELVIGRIRQSGADLVLVGISTPKQERWMFAHREHLPGVVLAGVGAAFDFHAGRVRQAPAWMQKHGLEWLFRLFAEPRRLWRRYILVTPRFLPLWAGDWIHKTAAKTLSGQ